MTLVQRSEPSSTQALRDAPGYILFTVWVSVCAFAPEAIWQGLLLLQGHFGPVEIYTALFIGTLFTVFVEPLLERLRAGRWRLTHGSSRNVVLTAIVSLGFGILAVCIHHSIDAYLGGAIGGPVARQAALANAMHQTQEWASLPAAIMVAWFLGHVRGRWAYPALCLACLWSVVAGILYGWPWLEVIVTAIPCCVIALLGTRIIHDHRTPWRVFALARVVGVVGAGWLCFIWAMGWIGARGGYPALEVYSPAQLAEDARFYLGWFLGLCVAPNPAYTAPKGK